MSRQDEQLTVAENTALILAANLPEEYVSTPERDRQTIARMYHQLHGKPVAGDNPRREDYGDEYGCG